MLKRLKGILVDQSGVVAVYLAIMMPILLGFAALAAEAGFWLMTQQRLQNIADAQAYSGAVLAQSGNQQESEIQGYIQEKTMTQASLDSNEVVINTPPLSGDYVDLPGFVEVILSQEIPRQISGIYDTAPVVITVRAVAGTGSGISSSNSICMFSLAPEGSGAISIEGNGNADMGDCAIALNSVDPNSLQISGNGGLETGCLDTTGGISDATESEMTMSVCSKPRLLQPAISDPYKDILSGVDIPIETATPWTYDDGDDDDDCKGKGNCKGGKGNSGNGNGGNSITDGTLETYELQYISNTLTPFALINGGLTLKGDVEIEPGLYIINGGEFNIVGDLSGTGVTFYLINSATLVVTAGARIGKSTSEPLTAPTNGVFSGMLFLSDEHDDPVTHTFTGNSDMYMNGIIYTPSDEIHLGGTGGMSVYDDDNHCFQIVSHSISIMGDSNVIFKDCIPAGTQPQLYLNSSIVLVE